MTTVETLLAKLVSFDTTSSRSNRACIDFIRDYLNDFGVTSEIITNDEGTKACLWATIGASDKPGIVLAGHSDTVPVEGQAWSSDPFTLTERDGKLYGRGSCDMKGFIACVLAVVPQLVNHTLAQPVHLAFTYDEEVTMEGASRLTDILRARGVVPEWVWIGEPTNLHVVDQHKGVAAFSYNFTGVSGHSGQPDKGLNAIDLGVDLIGILRRVAQDKKDHPVTPSRFTPPYTTFNLGVIKGGTAENIIADHCEVLWQVRPHPGDDIEGIRAAVDAQVEAEIAPRFRAFAPRAGMTVCTHCNIPPLMPTVDNPGEKMLTRLTGYTETESVSFATEAGFFQKLGTHVVICGPGSIDQAHQPDEFIDKKQLLAGVDLLGRVLLNASL